MTLEIVGFDIKERIYLGRNSQVYSGVRSSDGLDVIIKTRRAEYTRSWDDRLRQEFETLARIDHPSVVKACELVPYRGGHALVMADFGGRSLRAWRDRKRPRVDAIGSSRLGIRKFLELAIRMARALEVVHAAQVVHKDINPNNILVHENTEAVQLIDFGIASVLPRESQGITNPGALEGTLLYMSPEQTGRMNRSIDYRTDLYSLGVTFYEMLTGHPPFESDDPMELVHHHIAHEPEPLSVLRDDIPPTVADIVMRLLCKAAEDRYQSAAGLYADLEACLEQIQNHGRIEPFSLGVQDALHTFHIPEKLYGREREIDILLSAFERAATGRAELLLVSGHAGAGKSALIHEVHRPIVRARGLFASSKFDQLQRGAPFSSLRKALSELVQQLLTETDDKLRYWRDALQEALGQNARIIIDTVPEVELIIGPQPAAAELPPLESQRRFHLVFRRFVQVFCRPEHPLCIFLDDLQWVDMETLAWLEDVLTDPNQDHLFIIGAYRSNEVDAAHPLRLTIDRLCQKNAPLDQLHLEPLDVATLALLCADMLVSESETLDELARQIHARTHGNPFFVNQLLLTLHRDGAIYFARDGGAWRVDLERVADAVLSDNVVELMIERIKRLPASAREVLELAACIGNSFDLDTLAQVTAKDRTEIREQVFATIREGLVTQVRGERDHSYRFLHDRVQQAAYGMLSEADRNATRLRIGRMMRDARPSLADDERLFEIIDHLNAGRDLITDADERRTLAELNLAASIRAKRSAAFAPARAYIQHAFALLPEDIWSTPSPLTLEMLLERAEVEHLSGHPEEAAALYEQALEHAGDDMAKASVYEKQIHFYTDRARFQDAYAAGRQGAALFGVKLPARFMPPHLLYDLAAIKLSLRNRRIEELVDLPVMEDERLRRSVALVCAVLKAAYQCRPELCVHNALEVVKLCLRHGNTPDAPIAYLVFGGIFLGGILGDLQAGWSFGRLALALLEKFGNQAQKAEVNFVCGYFATSWTRPAHEAEEHFRVAYHTGLETGDIFHASCGCTGLVQGMYMRGVPMTTVLDEIERFRGFLERVGSDENIGTLLCARQAIRNLRGETHARDSFDDHEFHESVFVEGLRDYGSEHFAHFYFVNKMQCLYLFGEYQRGLAVAAQSAGHLESSRGMLQSAEHYFYQALLHAAVHEAASPAERRAGRAAMRESLKRMRKWAARCPDNFEHKRLLLEAELARMRGQVVHASACYDRAIDMAQSHGYMHHEALANELAGRFYLGLERRRLARFYLRNALSGYRAWGAFGLAQALLERFPTMFDASDSERITTSRLRPLSDTSHTIADSHSGMSSTLDLTSVIKSSQVLSGEIQLARLLVKLMRLVIENAGAQRGVLFLQDRRTLRVQAEQSVDSSEAQVLEGTPLSEYRGAAHTIVHYVMRSGKSLVLRDAVRHNNFAGDPYVIEHEPRSVLCAPLINQGQIRGVLYLENNLTVGAFTEERLEVLELLSGQITISIDNALHYEQLEEKVAERTEEIAREKERSEALLLNILPKQTAEELKTQGRATTRHYDMVSVLFTDFVGFTASVSVMPPQVLIRELDRCFRRFDELVEAYNLEKIKTIGDSYMCAGGIPVSNRTNPVEAVLAGLALQRYTWQFASAKRAKGEPFWLCRTGIHTGPVIAGVVGKNKFAYDIWGDTVNVASRMESGGEVHRVNISGTTYALVQDFFQCTYRGKIHAKGKGAIDMYFVDGIVPELSENGDGQNPNDLFYQRLDDLRNSLSGDVISLNELSSIDEA